MISLAPVISSNPPTNPLKNSPIFKTKSFAFPSSLTTKAIGVPNNLAPINGTFPIIFENTVGTAVSTPYSFTSPPEKSSRETFQSSLSLPFAAKDRISIFFCCPSPKTPGKRFLKVVPIPLNTPEIPPPDS